MTHNRQREGVDFNVDPDTWPDGWDPSMGTTRKEYLKNRHKNNTKIVLDENDLITIVMKSVGTNGQISIGSEFKGMPVIAYVVADKRNYVVDDKNSKRKK